MKTEVRFVSCKRVLKQVIDHRPRVIGPAWCKAQSSELPFRKLEWMLPKDRPWVQVTGFETIYNWTLWAASSLP